MSFFISRIVAEENPEQNYESSTYDYVPYSGDFDSNASSEMDGSDSYYSGPNEDINYEDDLDTNYNTDLEHGSAGNITTSENHILPQPSQNNAAAATKNFFGSKAPPVKAKSNTSSFFKHGQNASRAPSPPLSYISSDSSCGSNDSLVLSGESTEEPLSSVTTGIALTTHSTQSATTEDSHDDTPVRASSPLTASTTEPAQAPRLDNVAKQLFSSPTATSTGGAATKKPKASVPAAPAVRPFTAPSSFFSGTAPKFVTSQVSVPSFTTYRSASFTPTLGSGLASKKTTTTAAAATGSLKPPLSNSSVPSQQQHQQSAVASKPKPKPKSKSVTFQMGTKSVTLAAGAQATSILQRGDSIEQMTAPVPSSLEGHTLSPETGSTRESFAPVTPRPHNSRSNSMMTTGVSDRAALHQVTPDTTNQYHHHTQNQQQQQQQQQQIDDHMSRYGDASDAVMVSPAAGASRTGTAVSADDGDDSHDSYGSAAGVDGGSSSLTLNATNHSTSASTLSLDSAAQALSLCAQMDQQAEELQDRLRRARDIVREGRTAMVQQMHSAARIHSQYLVEDSVASAAPKLMELRRKMEQLRVRYKTIETARDQQQQRVPVPMPMEVT